MIFEKINFTNFQNNVEFENFIQNELEKYNNLLLIIDIELPNIDLNNYSVDLITKNSDILNKNKNMNKCLIILIKEKNFNLLNTIFPKIKNFPVFIIFENKKPQMIIEGKYLILK